ncbi:MAG TPA: DUF4262 domain-containing protein [Alcanivoracaceae bacterium]|nr:DUF4262 domain-containing protein [Alcanivoracaceae bacterium]
MAITPVIKSFTWPVAEDEQDKHIFSEVNQQGWHGLHVPAKNKEPNYSFSVGHYLTKKHPEIIIVGAPEKVAQKLLAQVALRVQAMDEKLLPNKPYRNFLQGLDVAFIPVAMRHYNTYLGFNNWFYGSLEHAYPVLQLVWPDTAGVFPWQRRYDKRFKALQPLLGKAPKTVVLH